MAAMNTKNAITTRNSPLTKPARISIRPYLEIRDQSSLGDAEMHNTFKAGVQKIHDQ